MEIENDMRATQRLHKNMISIFEKANEPDKESQGSDELEQKQSRGIKSPLSGTTSPQESAKVPLDGGGRRATSLKAPDPRLPSSFSTSFNLKAPDSNAVDSMLRDETARERSSLRV